MVDAYPDNNPKTVIGLTKPSFHAIPPSALIHLGAGMKNGKDKYGLMNWRDRQVTASIYLDAQLRHIFAWWDGEDIARDSGVHHLGHVMACNAILLDAMETGKLLDDRPIKGTFADIVDRLTVKK